MMRPTKARTGTVSSVAVISLLALAFLVFLSPFTPAKAFAPAYCAASSSPSGQYTATSFTSLTTSMVASILVKHCATNGNLLVLAAYFPVNNASTGSQVTGIHFVDNVSNTYTLINTGQYLTCGNAGAANYQCPKTHPGNLYRPFQSFNYYTYAVYLNGASLNDLGLTITINAPGYNCAAVCDVILVWEIYIGAALPTTQTCGGLSGTASDATLVLGPGNPPADTCTVTIPPGGVAVQVMMYNANAGNTFAFVPAYAVQDAVASQGVDYATKYCPNAGNQCEFSMAYIINAATTSETASFGYQITSYGGGAGNWFSQNTVVLTSVAAGSATTTTINTGCLGACSGGANATGTTFTIGMPQLMIFYASTNAPSSAQIDNVTLKVASVKINAVSGTCYVATYTASGIPSGGNSYTLLNTVSVPVHNQTTNFFVHTNPQANLGPGIYYAVGWMCGTTASRSSGFTGGNGVQIYESSQSGITMYSVPAGGSSPPLTMFSNTVDTPNAFISIITILTIATYTISTTITQGGGTATSTTTTTSTSTEVVNQGDPTKPTFWYIPMFFMLFFVAVFLGAYGMVNAVTNNRLR